MKNNNKGFSLVELIVVIAIMAILAAVAVVGFSMYIPKAQMAGDKQTVSDVKDALTLYYYSNPDDFTGGYVVLTLKDSGVEATADEFGEAAMVAAFGENWKEKVFLQYDGWNSEYTESSFQGNEIVLMGKVDGLTDVLAETIKAQPGLVGSGGRFENYMSQELGFSAEDQQNSNKVADAAVLYVANGTDSLSPEKRAEFSSVVKNSGGNFNAMLEGLIPVYDGNVVMASAATYAMMTAYLQYEDKLAGNTDCMDALADIDGSVVATGTPEEMLAALMASYEPASDKIEKNEDGMPVNLQKYLETEIEKDAAAFIDVMSTVNNSKDKIVGDLGTPGCFTTEELSDVFAAYGAGGVVILAEIQEDGSFVTRLMADMD